ncbi:endonuclease/exonuclease/phosphatase family protein [Terrabacter aerolatus]|uniref:Endonuclease n=1 Tax=Terrabacter aerolatus TaxID=422442 RepID=A0A512D3B8_9MICO|nr:endonuclease/exonuclease/phosphatase family protein [Terrabacter aerolatus]GEO30770.1 endonuclease [Terrabacter aerolatus]
MTVHEVEKGTGRPGDDLAATDVEDNEQAAPAREAARRRVPARRWLDVAIGVVLVGLGAVGALRWWDSTAYVVVVLQTAGPFVVVGLGLLAVATLLLRRWWMLVPVVAVLVVASAVAAPAFRASTSPKADRDLTVMSANVWIGSANAAQLMDAVRFHSVDVLVVTEATPEFVRRLDSEGATDYFNHREGVARSETYTGTMVLSRYPLSVRSLGTDPAVEGTRSIQPELDVTVPNGTVRLKVAHPTAPLQGDTAEWRAGLRALQTWKERLDGDEPLVMAGDFNAGFGHPGFRDLADGLDDAQRTDGQGWVRTWPFAGHRLPAFVQLDHLLSRGLTVVEAGQVAFNRADHAAVWASYHLPAR